MKDEKLENGDNRRGVSDLNCLLAPREIKFRAKLYEDDKWVYGGGIQQVGENMGMISLDNKRQLVIYQVEPETVGQFTGLKDKSDDRIKIFEGDILGLGRYTTDSRSETVDYESIHKVVWGGKDYPAFDLSPHFTCDMNALSYLACACDAPDYEVIGNVFENPELIREC